MLTPDTIIDAPVLIAPGRPPWTGTIQEAFALDEGMWNTLGELLSLHAPGPEDAIVEAADGERVSGFRPDRIRALIAANTPSASPASNAGNAGSTPGQPLQPSCAENLGMRL